MITRAWNKLISQPLKYANAKGYDAEKYWRDRFARHGYSLLSVGHEGQSEQENRERYAKCTAKITHLLTHKDYNTSQVLEIGVGQGHYTRVAHTVGTSNYHGIDITDQYFKILRGEFKNYTFAKAQAGTDWIRGKYSLVLAIDVIQHIVTKQELRTLLNNIADVLTPGGKVIVTGISIDKAWLRLFYVRHWALADIVEFCPPELKLTWTDTWPNGLLINLEKIKC